MEKINLISSTDEFYKNSKGFINIFLVFLFSAAIYIVAALNNDLFMNFMSVASYLRWHAIFEFFSILVSFSIFTVTYFVYDESGKFKMLILGCTFLLMGLLDSFHTLSFKGMADFFVSNSNANRATILWVFSRTFGSLGFLLASYFPTETTFKINKKLFVFATTSFSILLFLTVTFFPNIFPAMIVEGIGLTKTKIIMEYLIILTMIITFIIVAVEYKRTNSSREYVLMIALILLIFCEFAFTNYGSVYDVFNYIGHVYKIIAFMILYKAIYVENIREPYREMKKARNELEEYSKKLNLIVKQRTKKLEEINSILMNDIENAKVMQRSLMPEQFPKDSSVSFYAKYLPAERLSGDFYNVMKLDEDNIAICIGDVSGHGVSAAMLTVFAHQNIMSFKGEDNSSEIISPGFVLKTMYKQFNNTNFNSQTYIVMLYGVYNTKNKIFTYASAGMNVSPYVIKKSGDVFELDSKGLPICKLGSQIMPFYDDRTIEVESGDKIVFYSDGLIEAKNMDNEIYGQLNLKNFLQRSTILNAKDIMDGLKNNLYEHIGFNGKLMDDATFLVMEVS